MKKLIKREGNLSLPDKKAGLLPENQTSATVGSTDKKRPGHLPLSSEERVMAAKKWGDDEGKL